MSEIDWRRDYSEDEVEQAFAAAFEKPAKYNDVSTWEGLVEWEGEEMTLVLEVTSMAGDLTRKQFEQNDEVTSVAVQMFDGVEVEFKAREVLTINGTDYRAIYVPVDDEDGEEVDDEEEEVDEELDGDIESASDLAGNVGWGELAE